MITTKKIDMKIKIPVKSAFEYETDLNLPKMHVNIAAVAKRGGGKTTCIVELMKRMNYDRIFLISPTLNSNYEMLSRLEIDEDDIYENPNDISILDDIMNKIDQEAADLEEYERKNKLYKYFMKNLNNDKTMNDQLLLEFYNPMTDMIEKPTHKWNGRRCKMALLIDDCLGTNLFIGKGLKLFNSLVIKHRHLGGLPVQKGAFGVSLFFLFQSYTSNTGGLSRTIRNNLTGMCLFKTKNEGELKKICEEMSGEVDPTLFMEIYDYATKDQFDFLFIDLHKKKEHPSSFRRCFDEFIIVDKLQEILDKKKSDEIAEKLGERIEK